jgi:glucuronoarabinoxylan endo-1,4-beta-xylanase
VDWANVHQRIDGFGGGVVFLNGSPPDPVNVTFMNTAYGTNANQLGLSLLRVRIDPNGNWSTALADAQKAVAHGAGILATPWTPPASMKDNNNPIGGSLLPAQYTNFANYLNNFAAYMKTNGAPLKAISIQNEPDYVPTDYEGCGWTPTQLQTFCHNVAGLITNAPLIMPESASYNQSMSDPTLNDPVAASNVTFVGEHLYGNGNAGVTIVDYPNAHSKGKPTWMTEFLVNDQSITNAIVTAKQIHDCLTIGNFSAYIWWKSFGNANGLVDASGVPQRRGFVMAQWSRFVPPGYYRIDANPSTGGAFITAYKDSNSLRFAIVAVNTNANTSIFQTFQLTNFTASSVTPWITSSNLSLAIQSPVAVTNASFAYTLPPWSVVTFAGQGYVAPTSITISNVSYNPATPAFVLTWNSTAGATYSVFRTNALVAPAAQWPVMVTGYPVGGATGGSLSYTDTTATFSPAFYRVSSP